MPEDSIGDLKKQIAEIKAKHPEWFPDVCPFCGFYSGQCPHCGRPRAFGIWGHLQWLSRLRWEFRRLFHWLRSEVKQRHKERLGWLRAHGKISFREYKRKVKKL